jgi:hypothetical protein
MRKALIEVNRAYVAENATTVFKIPYCIGKHLQFERQDLLTKYGAEVQMNFVSCMLTNKVRKM